MRARRVGDAPVHPTVAAERLRAEGQTDIDIANQIGVSVVVVHRWFELVDDLKTRRERGYPQPAGREG